MRDYLADPAVAARFWTKVDKRPDGCWVWTAGRAGPRGAFNLTLPPEERRRSSRHQRTFGAHRLAWIHSGRPLAEREPLENTCGDEACVRPEHWRVITPDERADRARRHNLLNAAQRPLRLPRATLSDAEWRHRWMWGAEQMRRDWEKQKKQEQDA